jgi:hypothetical protein
VLRSHSRWGHFTRALHYGDFRSEFLRGTEALIILSIGQFINAATGPVSNILVMTGRQKLNRNLMVGTTIIAIILDLILIPIYGIVGAACVNTFGIILMNLIPFFLIKYYYGFYTLDFKELFKVNPRTFVREIRQALKPGKKKKENGTKRVPLKSRIHQLNDVIFRDFLLTLFFTFAPLKQTWLR